MKRFDTVLFDLDGTLLDTLEDLQTSLNHVLEDYDYPPRSAQQVRRALGNGAQRLMELSVPGGAENPRFAQMLADFRAYYTAHCDNKTGLYPGVGALLERLRAEGFRLAVVSNKPHSAVAELGLRFFPQIPVCMGQREDIRRKPAPDMVFRALEALGAERERAVYVGDSEVDLQTAENTGLPCVLVSWGFRDRPELEKLGPWGLADDADGLYALLTAEKE